MAAEDPVIVSVGMISAVGLTAPEVAASVRGGVMRFAESDIRDQRFRPLTLALVPEAGLPELEESLRERGLTTREIRMLRLAALPLQECVAGLTAGKRPLPLLLAVPDSETTRAFDAARFLQALQAQVPNLVDPRRANATFGGRAGGLQAIGQAADLVRSGAADYVIAGGVDTFRDLYILSTLELERRIKTAANPDALIPGEGAAFVAIARRGAAEAAGLVPLATISAWAHGFENGHLYSEQPYQGNGLASTFQQLVSAGESSLPVREVYSSMNGESHFAKEWGVAFMRSRSAFADDHGMHHPADSYGDTGAAAVPMMIGLAALGIAGGYRRASALVYGSSDRGARAAALVSA